MCAPIQHNKLLPLELGKGLVEAMKVDLYSMNLFYLLIVLDTIEKHSCTFDVTLSCRHDSLQWRELERSRQHSMQSSARCPLALPAIIECNPPFARTYILINQSIVNEY